MRTLIGLAAAPVAVYAIVLAFLYWMQDALLYPASGGRVDAAQAGLADFTDLILATPDGERLVAWYMAPRPGRVTLLYFHGNGGSLVNRRFRASMLSEAGRGLLLVSYRGYSGSSGRPSEVGLRVDARTAYDWLSLQSPAPRIVLYGESLGTGVALELAAERQVAGVILDAPYTSIAEVARHHFSYVPTGWLMRDQYRSIDLVQKVKAPLLAMHGARDAVIPIGLGERLYAAAPEPKRFVRLAGSHVENLEEGGIAAVRSFLDEIESTFPEAQSIDPPP